MKKCTEDKIPVAPSTWIDAAQKLNIFIGDENDTLYQLEHTVANMKFNILKDPDMTVAKSKAIVEASEDYKQYRIQQARVKQIQEFIRIAKKQATIRDTEFKGY